MALGSAPPTISLEHLEELAKYLMRITGSVCDLGKHRQLIVPAEPISFQYSLLSHVQGTHNVIANKKRARANVYNSRISWSKLAAS